MSKSFVAYHGTNAIFTRFDSKKTAQGIIWFSTDRDRIIRGEAGAQGLGRILKVRVTIKKPAGWDEYQKLSLGELRRDYDGVVLKEEDEDYFDGVCFSWITNEDSRRESVRIQETDNEIS